jgi:hypothetical protein
MSPSPVTVKSKWFRVETAIFLFAAWQARDIAWAWVHSPYDRAGGPAFLLWLAPAVWVAWHRMETPPPRWRVWVALIFTAIGGMSGINSLNYIALAVALAGCFPLLGARRWRWLFLSISWMPLLGWLGAKVGLPVVAVGVLRIVVALATLLG